MPIHWDFFSKEKDIDFADGLRQIYIMYYK